MLYEYMVALKVANLPAFPGKIFVGRSHTQAVTEKRAKQLHAYLRELLAMGPEVSESVELYTFLHYTDRDKLDTHERGNSSLGTSRNFSRDSSSALPGDNVDTTRASVVPLLEDDDSNAAAPAVC